MKFSVNTNGLAPQVGALDGISSELRGLGTQIDGIISDGILSGAYGTSVAESLQICKRNIGNQSNSVFQLSKSLDQSLRSYQFYESNILENIKIGDLGSFYQQKSGNNLRSTDFDRSQQNYARTLQRWMIERRLLNNPDYFKYWADMIKANSGTMSLQLVTPAGKEKIGEAVALALFYINQQYDIEQFKKDLEKNGSAEMSIHEEDSDPYINSWNGWYTERTSSKSIGKISVDKENGTAEMSAAEGSVTIIDGWEDWNGWKQKTTAEGAIDKISVANHSGFSNDMTKGNVGVEISGDISFSKMEGSIKENQLISDQEWDLREKGVAGKAENVTVGAGTGLQLYKDGKLDPKLYIKAKGEAVGLQVNYNDRTGTEDYNIHSNDTAKAGVASAEAGAYAGWYDDEDGGKKFGVKGKAGVEAYAFQVEGKRGITIMGIDFDLTVSGKFIGGGVSTGGEISTSSAEGEIDLGLGAGVGVKVGVDWSDAKWPWKEDNTAVQA